MAIPKSAKLQAEEVKSAPKIPSSIANKTTAADNQHDGPIQIREVQCCNDFVAILQFQFNTNIAMVDDESTYKNEGMVVGVGPGIADGAGGRLTPSVKIGDVVMFSKNIVAQIESSSPPYKGQKVILVSERNIMCKIPTKVAFEHYKDS